MAYSSAFKRRMIQRLEEPGAPSATQIAEEAGVSISTLSRWRSQARAARIPAAGETMTTQVTPNKRTPQDKLRIIMQAAALTDDQLGIFLRKEGIHQAQLEQWRDEALSGLATAPARSLKKKRSSAADRKRIRQLEKELHRKEKALAESAALLMLQKKVQVIWGDGGENT